MDGREQSGDSVQLCRLWANYRERTESADVWEKFVADSEQGPML